MAYEIKDIVTARNVPACGNQKKFIAVHYLGVDGQNNDIAPDGCGAHYYIYWDGTIYKRCSHDAVVWQVGTAGTYTQKHPTARNANTIGIELCCHCDGNKASADDPKWYFTEATQKAAVWLVQKLMKELSIPITNVLRHYDIVSKVCPAPYVHNNRYKGTWTWGEFLEAVQGTTPAVVKWYRVRKTWKDEKSQLGAYQVLQNAKDNCPAGYVVFDDNGKAVYTPDTPHVYSPEEWFAEIAPIAVNLAKKNRILPSVVIAQTYLETGCGTTDLTGKRNIIGMKADLINNTWISVWDGKTYAKKTPEYVNGQLIHKEDTFRVYRSFAQCLEDYEAFLLGVQNEKGYKYRRIQGWTDPANVINAIKIGTGTNAYPEGYCTDPNYETKILNIISQFNLTKYDAVMRETATATSTIPTTAPSTKDKYVVRKSFSDSKSQTNSFNSLDNAKREADKYGYTVYEAATGKAVYTPAAAVKDKYAVRHNIDDKAYQLGLFHDLANAKKLADQNWGYKVFDTTTGKCVYEPKLTKAQKLVAECVWMDLIVRDDIKIGRVWTYKNKNTKKLSRTFDDARKEYNFKTNCSTAVYWALLRSKVVNSNRDGIQWNGNNGFVWLNDHAKKDALKYFKLISVREKTMRKCMGDGTVQPGDVISFVGLAHTCIYIGQGLTYDTGHHNCAGSGEGAKFKCWASKAGYQNYKVAEILRPRL